MVQLTATDDLNVGTSMKALDNNRKAHCKKYSHWLQTMQSPTFLVKESAGTEELVVGLNSDKWLERKKGQSFLPYYEREQILLNTKSVDNVIGFDDDDDSATDAILKVQHFYPNAEIIFANGGDRSKQNIPEIDIFKGTNVLFEFGVGGSKRNSSSAILEKWSNKHTERPWGYYRVLHN